MVLTIDIGNTNIVLGGYENGALGFCTRISTDKKLGGGPVRAGAVRHPESLQGGGGKHRRRHHFQRGAADHRHSGAGAAHVCGRGTAEAHAGAAHRRRGEHRHTLGLGADLLAGAIAAKALYPLPAIVIDMGTATKITAVDEQGTVQGVSIMPGVFISLDALVNGTSLLKGIATNAPVRAIGKKHRGKHAERRGIRCGKHAGRTAWSSASKPSSAPQKRWWLPAVRRALLCRTAGTACNMCPHSFWTAFMPCTAAHAAL